ncbi:MAG: AI-2E family transporter [Oscillospiraceae bacterium]|nr:AI-2E family transporter [Oscillospiraceae bacterium]
MKVHMDDRQRSIAKTAVWIFSVCLTIGIAVWRWSSLVEIFRKILSVMAPVLVGLVLAYLMSPLQNWLEIRIGRFTDKNKPHPRLKRALSVTGAILVLLIAIFGLVAAIVPELISSIKNLLVSLPEYLTNMTDWINAHIASLKDDQPQLYSVLTNIWDTALNSANNFADQFEPKLDSIASGGADVISTLTSGAVSVFKWLTNFLLGIIITIYLLYNKETYLAQARKLLYAVLPEKNVHTFLEIGSHVSYKFMHFLSGKTLDSMIIGLLCFTGMTILNMPYTTLISILVGVTNIIPFFGPIIGAVPSALLILLSEPRKLIPFVIFILVLQQFDGNFLGPKILGESLGLPMFWTLFAITVGGGIFGFVGMVAFVPIFAAVYTLFSDFLSEQLHKKGLPADTANYMTNEIHYASPPQKSDTLMPSDEDDQPKMPEVPDDEEDYVPVPVEEIADRAESSDQSE